MDAHLKGIPGLGTLTTGGLSGCIQCQLFPKFVYSLYSQPEIATLLPLLPKIANIRKLLTGDLQSLGWETDGTLDAEVLGLCTVDELFADLLEGADLSASQGDSIPL